MADNKNMTNSLPQKSTSLSPTAGEEERNKLVPSENEKQKENPHLKIVIEEMIKKTTRHPLSSDYRCIYRVTQALRKQNENSYTPEIVSIGPLHHEDKHLKRMEDVKVRYFEQFLQRAAKTLAFNKPPHPGDNREALQTSKNDDYQIMNNFSRLGDFLSILKSLEQKIRQSYAEHLNHSGEELLKIILVDAAFIIELFLRSHFGNEDNTLTKFEHVYTRCDLWLIENQVPFFVLDELYKAAFGYYGTASYPSFMKLACEYFKIYNKQQRPIERETINHFTDLVRIFLLPVAEAKSSDGAGVSCCGLSLKPCETGVSCCGLSLKHREDKQPSDHKPKPLKGLLKSATQLHAAGVKFHVKRSSKCLLDINFSNPILEMPCLDLYEETAALFRNIIALEQYHYPNKAIFCDYVLLMDCLIDTKEDAGLLVEKRIINNWLGSNEKVASLFNSLCVNILKGDTIEQFKFLVQELNDYYKKPWHGWKATFRRQYCSTPWKTASAFAAVILLALTLAQTVLSVFAL